MTVDIKEKEDNQIEELKEVTKRKFVKPISSKSNQDKVQPNDVSTTLRIPYKLREQVAIYCHENSITMNSFILEAIRKQLHQS
jgi:predicted HicB family RNase H-like nuclease